MALKRGIKMENIIYIKDLRIKTIIGIFDWERKVKQEVSIDMEFPFDCKKAAATDSIEDTIDYKAITKGVIKFVEESSFQLQEMLPFYQTYLLLTLVLLSLPCHQK